MLRCIGLIAILLSTLTACARPTPALLPPEEIMGRVVARMKALKGFSFVIVRTGAPAYLDAARTFSLSRLEGNFVAPDQAQGQARVIGPGIVGSIKFISIGQHYWETHYLTGEWWECPLGQCFNPAILFDPKAGLQPILESDLSNLQRLNNAELEELPGKELYALTGKLKGEHIYPLSWNMIGPDGINAQLWIDPVTFDLHRMRLEEPATNGAEATIWMVDFLNFNQATPIQAPRVPTPISPD
jgi:hypothetical protein